MPVHIFYKTCFKSGIAAFLLLLFLSRCANIVPPGGGPKDTIPPYLVSANPADSSLHFKSSRITLNFDEFIQLSNDYSNVLIFAPRMKRQPIINVKLRTITILLKDTLQPNTTYQINFGNAVQDINESNPLKDFDYVFSTGDYLDSLEISGNVRYAETGLPDSNVLVMLYKTIADSVVSREKPLYYARTNGQGYFRLHNLPHDTFKLFALKEDNSDLVYDEQGTEFIAFQSDSMRLDSSVQHMDLYLFKEPPKPDTSQKAEPAAVPEGKKEEKADSAKTPAKPKLAFAASLSNGKQDITAPLLLQSSEALKELDSSKILLLEDTLKKSVPVHVTLDDSVHKSLSVQYTWKEGMPYQLLLQEGFGSDSTGNLSKADTINFKTKSTSEYGAVILQFNGVDTTLHYVVQLVKDKSIVYAAPLKGNTWKVDLFNPGDYGIRLLKDDNQNGHWDSGQYFGTKRQPERVYAIPQKLTVRANWDNKLIINFDPDAVL